MRLIVKSLLVTLLAATLIFGTIYGIAANLDIKWVGAVGAGTAHVPEPPPVDWGWILSDGKVSEVELKFAGSFYGDIYVEVRNGSGNVISKGSASGVQVHSTYRLDIEPDVWSESIEDIYIAVAERP
jgi:hypothetical protein